MCPLEVDTMSTVAITYADVRDSIAIARSHGEKFFEQIVWQVENQVWTVLGYASWDEMREVEYHDMGVVAPRADRPELVARLRSNGLTQKQIGDTLGISHQTVGRAVNVQMDNEVPATITNARGQERPATYERRSTPVPELTPEPVAVVAEPVTVETIIDAATGEITDTYIEPPTIPGAHVGNNSGEVEWYTPPEYIEAARTVMGGIDLDPASNAIANEMVKADRFYSAEDDGLAQQWAGRVWMNPPYANGLMSAFCTRLTDSYLAGHVTEAVVLSNNATETRWFQSLAAVATSICLHRGRIRFWYPDRPSFTPLQGQSILYLGQHPDRFAAAFGQFGLIVDIRR